MRPTHRGRGLVACGIALLVAGFPTGAAAAAPAAARSPAPTWTWFEAEDAPESGNDELSGGGMIWVAPGGAIRKSVRIPADGTYSLWIRKFWNPQSIRWRIGADAGPREVRESTLSDLLILDGDPGRRVGWFNAGTVSLAAGEHRFQVEPLPDETRTTAYDCFLLTSAGFVPRGKLKPGEKAVLDQPGWFAFEPDPDPFTDSPLDLRHLNENSAGDDGFIRVRDEEFVHEKSGRPARFWAVNVGMGFVASAPGDLAIFARGMAKRGVNMVRVHGPIYATEGPRFGTVDTRRIAQLHAFAAALKREGIYTALSIYFPLWVAPGPDHPDFPGYTRGQHPFGLPYFSAAFQRLYREWWRALLVPVNPATGLAFKDDPAIAFAEMINEDSTLFWTFNPADPTRSNLPEPQRALLERRFGDWLRKRHPAQPSLAAIRDEVWQGTASPQDQLEAGRVGIRPLWEIFNRRTPRDRDTARFLTELMTDFHRETRDFLKQELGYRGLVYGSNWKTASPRYLDPLDKHANAVGDFFDRHGYLGGLHEGPNAAWNLETRQRYDDRSALLFRRPGGTGDDFDNPVFDLIYNGRPSVITEINWPLPNRFRADMVPFGACYGAVQGTDGIFWFAAGSPAWDGLPGKFSIQTPTVLGQFPAAALIYRRGLVKTAPRVVDLAVSVKSLLDLEGTPVPAPQNFDALRGQDIPPGGMLTNASAIDSLAFLVGRVGLDLVESGATRSHVVELSPWLDRTARKVQSHGRDLELDWGLGLLSLRAGSAQGAAGFLRAAGSRELPDLIVASPLEYGAILVVSLDDEPLGRSRRMLVQVASEEQPWRWATDAPTGPRTITHRGTGPLLVRNFAGTVRFRRAATERWVATPLDYNGYPEGPGIALDAEHPLELLPATPYYLVQPEADRALPARTP